MTTSCASCCSSCQEWCSSLGVACAGAGSMAACTELVDSATALAPAWLWCVWCSTLSVVTLISLSVLATFSPSGGGAGAAALPDVTFPGRRCRPSSPPASPPSMFDSALRLRWPRRGAHPRRRLLVPRDALLPLDGPLRAGEGGHRGLLGRRRGRRRARVPISLVAARWQRWLASLGSSNPRGRRLRSAVRRRRRADAGDPRGGRRVMRRRPAAAAARSTSRCSRAAERACGVSRRTPPMLEPAARRWARASTTRGNGERPRRHGRPDLPTLERARPRHRARAARGAPGGPPRLPAPRGFQRCQRRRARGPLSRRSAQNEPRAGRLQGGASAQRRRRRLLRPNRLRLPRRRAKRARARRAACRPAAQTRRRKRRFRCKSMM